MIIKALKTFSDGLISLHEGEVAKVSDAKATIFIADGLAVEYTGSADVDLTDYAKLEDLADYAKTSELGYCKPEDFGAKGDGVTNDYDALVQAMTDASTNKKVLKLTKNYYSGSKLTIPHGLLVEGNAVTVTTQQNLIPKVWNIKSPNGVEAQGHVTLRNVGFLENGITVTGSRVQIDECSFTECEPAIELYNATSSWHGEVYIRNCYFRNCIEGVISTKADNGINYTDCQISGCTAINNNKTADSNPLVNNDVFMKGDFVGFLMYDNHIYTSKVMADVRLSGALISNNYFDTIFTHIEAQIMGNVVIKGNYFFASDVPNGWDNESDFYICSFARQGTGGTKKKMLDFSNNFFATSTVEAVREKQLSHAVFVNITTPIYMIYKNNMCTIKNYALTGTATDYDKRYIITDTNDFSITYNSKTLPVVSVDDGLAIYGSVAYDASVGSHTIPSYGGVENPTDAIVEGRFYADFSYKDSNSDDKLARVRVYLTWSKKVIIDNVPADYSSDGIVHFNTVLTDFHKDPSGRA